MIINRGQVRRQIIGRILGIVAVWILAGLGFPLAVPLLVSAPGLAGRSASCWWSIRSCKASAGRARMPMARARRAPIGSVSPRVVRMSAIRFTVATNQTASPAAAFATMVFRPSSESKGGIRLSV
jgi:hypothetical protein